MVGHGRVAIRTLLSRPGLAAGRVATIAVVMTAATAVFTVANAVFLTPLPFPRASRLVRVFMQPPGTTGYQNGVSLPPLPYLRLRHEVPALERFEGMWVVDRAVAGDAGPESVTAARVSGGWFDLLGATPVVGRVFTDDDVTADLKVVVLSHAFWQRRFNGSPSAIGQTLSIDDESHTVVGVVEPGFAAGLLTSEFWTPMNLRAFERQASALVQVFGRLRPGATAAAATREMNAALPALTTEMPVLKGWSIGTVDLRLFIFGPQHSAILTLLAAVAGLALLASANLANLTLADVTSRRADFALRAALGASRTDIAAPEVARGLLIAVAGAAAGLVGGAFFVPMLLALDPSNSLAARQLGLDWRVAVLTFASATVIVMIATAGPLVRFCGRGLATDLASGSRRAAGGRGTSRLRTLFVVAQTSLALVLLASGALIVSTLQRTAAVDPGFDPTNVVTAQLRLPAAKYGTEAARAEFVERLLERLGQTPGVAAAGTTMNPFVAGGSSITGAFVEDHPTSDGQPYTLQFRRVSPGYFHTMGIPIVSGRDVTSQDRIGTALVVLVSRSMAERFWPGVSPIGRRIRRSAVPEWMTIVGVVEDVQDLGLNVPPADTIYTPVYQGSSTQIRVSLVVRTLASPDTTMDAIRRAVWAVDPHQPLASVVTLDQFLSNTLGPQRFRATLVSFCGVLGLMLATIGVYGITARSVVERRREVGVRLALGGRPGVVWWTVAGASLRAVGLGAMLGLVVAMVAREGLAALLPELSGGGAAFSLAAAGVLIAVGGLAALVAARSAATLDPLVALRAE